MLGRIVFAAVLALGFLLAGCGSSSTDKPDDKGVDVVEGDAQLDSVESDQGIDTVAPDLGGDAVAPDLGGDAVAPDLGGDAIAPDLPADMVADAPMDAATDLAADTLADADPDSSADASGDVASSDASSWPNASCASPTAVQLGGTPVVINGDTTGATNEFGSSIYCGGFSAFSGQQLYYQVSVSAGRGYRFELQPTGWDGGLYLFEDTTCDPSTINTQCAANVADANITGGTETMVVVPSTSTTVVVAVDSAVTSSAAYGPFTLTIEQFALPSNSTCAQPQPVTLQAGQTTTIQGDTSPAFNEFGMDITCSLIPFYGPQLYYKANLEAGKAYRFNVSAAWDSAVYAFTDTTCDAATIENQCSKLVSDFGFTGDDETLIIAPTTTEDYIVAVDSMFANESGTFTLTVDEVFPPANNKCSAAEVLTFSGNVATATGDTETASNDAGLSTSACGGGLAGTLGPDVFYSATLTAGTTYTIEVVPDALYDPAVYVLTDCADPETSCVYGEDSAMGGDTETITFTPTTTQTYYIGVDSWTTAESGTFTLTASY